MIIDRRIRDMDKDTAMAMIVLWSIPDIRCGRIDVSVEDGDGVDELRMILVC